MQRERHDKFAHRLNDLTLKKVPSGVANNNNKKIRIKQNSTATKKKKRKRLTMNEWMKETKSKRFQNKLTIREPN